MLQADLSGQDAALPAEQREPFQSDPEAKEFSETAGGAAEIDQLNGPAS